MKKLLFINCCIRDESISRTNRLCHSFLDKLDKKYIVEEVKLKNEHLMPYDNERIEIRDELLKSENFDNPVFGLARQFAEADRIVIGAPFWDLCFPALLKIYFEHIFVAGITFRYEESGVRGLCKAEKLLMIQSVGGFVRKDDVTEKYLSDMCEMFGINCWKRVCAECVDISPEFEEKNMKAAKDTLEKMSINF